MEQPRLEVAEVPVASLVPYAGNAKQHPSEQVDQIAASIREFGNCDPIAVWTNADGEPEIVEGHGRLLALQRLGIETAPVIRLDHLTDEQRRAYTHVHNQTTLSSGFDLDALAADIADLPAFDWESFGFDDVSIDGFGVGFELPDGDGPQFKTITLHLTSDQHEIVSNAIESVDECSTDGGNENGRKLTEVCIQWGRR